MADNVIVYNTGTAGATVSTDDVVYAGATVQMQRVKIHDGIDGGTAGWTIASGAGLVHVNNSGTVTLTGTNPTFQTNNGTVTLTGVNPVFVTNNATVASVTNLGSVTTGHGHTLGIAQINLTATGTVVTAITSKKIKVYAETFTVNSATVTVARMSGHAGATIIPAQMFVPGGGIAWANSREAPLFETAAGSPLVYTLTNFVGTGTVAGLIRYFEEA
jgi:hypothetical protein